MSIGQKLLPVLLCQLIRVGDLHLQQADRAGLFPPVGGVDDDEGLVAVHQLLDHPDAGDPGLEYHDALWHAILGEPPDDRYPEAVVPEQVVAHTGHQHTGRHPDSTSSTPTAIFISPSPTATGSAASLPSPSSSRLPVRTS